MWLIKVIETDDATYSVDRVIAVCTDEITAIELEEEAKQEHHNKVYIEEIEVNKIIG
ncbi:hypothetical protein [Priestia flexa]|uniref:hypothetical protein n=1 Tax=Priestia flexa TaxID=86664 RepID=UPI000B2FEE63|nr:hypothetical protein [Priestia flexa]